MEKNDGISRLLEGNKCVVCGRLTGPTAPVGTCANPVCLLAMALKYREERDRLKELCEATLKQVDAVLNVLQKRSGEEVTHG